MVDVSPAIAWGQAGYVTSEEGMIEIRQMLERMKEQDPDEGSAIEFREKPAK